MTSHCRGVGREVVLGVTLHGGGGGGMRGGTAMLHCATLLHCAATSVNCIEL